MMWLKTCPRCRGDLYVERGIGETYVSCLQCGHTLNKMEEEHLRQSPAYQRRVGVTRAA